MVQPQQASEGKEEEVVQASATPVCRSLKQKDPESKNQPGLQVSLRPEGTAVGNRPIVPPSSAKPTTILSGNMVCSTTGPCLQEQLMLGVTGLEPSDLQAVVPVPHREYRQTLDWGGGVEWSAGMRVCHPCS